MVNAVRKHPVEILLGITVRILKDAVMHTHRQGSDETGNRGDFDARLKGSDVHRLGSSATCSSDADPFRIYVSASQQINEGSQCDSKFPAGEVCTCEISKVAKNRVLSTDQVITAFPSLGVPELAAFSL